MDFVAVGMMLIQAGVVVYALWSFKVLTRKMEKAWTVFVMCLLGMFCTRAFIVVRCLDVGDYPYIQYPLMLAVNVGLILFIRDMRVR
jgi:hypothetical protein